LKRKSSVNFGNLLLSLSEALYLAGPLVALHQERVAYIVWSMGVAGGLPEDMLETHFTAALLHDIGAISVEEKIAIHNFEEENTDRHCICGEVLLKSIPWFEDISKIIRHHHRKWQEWDRKIEEPDILGAQMVFLADYIERLVDRNQYILHQSQKIISKITSLSGTYFHPLVVDYFLATSKREEFWFDLVSPRLYSLLLSEGPYRRMEIDILEITPISELFRSIIDFKSRFTATHSAGVAACAEYLSRLYGFTETESQLMKIAGDLHDIGKLGVPNKILEKPGKLNQEEFAIMKSHTYHTYNVINTIAGLRQIAEWAAYHHERLDGSGYPFHCSADELNSGARIMAVADIFTALAEDRPYRKGMTRKEIKKILKDLASNSILDARIVNLLFKNIDQISAYVKKKQASAKKFYEQQFGYVEPKKLSYIGDGPGHHQ
jgi:HD-GYP domain-containing protein (c-di-GMP phosphodiesterase class II)